MSLTTYTLDQFVEFFIGAVQDALPPGVELDSGEGSVLLAFAEAVASNNIVIQGQVLQVQEAMRLATAVGDDVDSFVADYRMLRSQARSAEGYVMLNRNITSANTSIPLSNNIPLLQTTVGSLQFQIIADPYPNAAWDPLNNEYNASVGVGSITVRVRATIAGTAGNVSAGSISKFVAGVSGFTSCTNVNAFTDGQDVESSIALKARFALYISNLALGTNGAIGAAILGLQAGMTYTIIEGLHFDESPFVAGICVVIDDGSGAPTPALQAQARVAVEAVRAAGIEFEVFPPTNVAIDTSCHIIATTNTNLILLQANLAKAIQQFILGLGVGVTLFYADIASLIEHYPGVYLASAIVVNGGTADVVITKTQVARPGTVVFP